MHEVTMTFRVDEVLRQEFALAAKQRDRTGAQLLRDYMREIVRQQHEADEYDAWFRRQVNVGLRQANAGEVLTSEEVEAEAAAWRMALRQRLAGGES